ncbi:MAG: metal-dependent hydrolase [Anaerolineae bacterium]
MKGITHFLTGIAIATCFPDVVDMARHGSLIPVLSGAAALLPDLLDFRFVRYLQHYDSEIDPASFSLAQDPNAAASAIADSLVAVMRDAHKAGQPRRVITHTLRLGADRWRRYTIRLDPEAGAVAVRIGPVVSTGGIVYPATDPPDAEWVVRRVGMPLVDTYRHQYDVDVFLGPSFRFTRQGHKLAVEFLDWHHRWTHSLLLALGAGVIVGALFWMLDGAAIAPLAGALVWLAMSAHVLEDQLGYMGNELFWPLVRHRIPGLGLLHADEATPNFLVVWTALAVILLNLDRLGGPSWLPVVPYLLLVIVLPWLLGIIHRVRRRASTSSDGVAAAAIDAERLAEAQHRPGYLP